MSYRNNNKKTYEQPQPSPIEISFWNTAKPLIPELQREAWIDKKYRVDFLLPSKNVIIELYGYEYHNTKYKITKDAERERYLQRKGYQVIRFTGSEIYKDAQKCVNELISLIHIQPAINPADSNEPIPKPINVNKIKASFAKEKYNAHTLRKKKILGMEKWQVNVLAVMFLTTVIILSCLGMFLSNLKVP